MCDIDEIYHHQQIALWLERMWNELRNTTSYMIPETSKIMREMKEEIGKE